MVHVLDVNHPLENSRPFTETIENQIYIEPKELIFDLGYFEPFFGSIALYDLKRKEKISETFHFDLNPEHILGLLPHVGKKDSISTTRQAIFSTSYCSPDIYLIIMISKTLRGDESDSAGPYLNAAKIKEKEKEKFINESRACAQRLGRYRQPFGYTVIQLYDENHTFKPSKNTMIQGLLRPKTEKDIYSWIEKGLSETKDKKKNTIPCKIYLDIRKLGEKEKLRGRLTPSLEPVKPLLKDFKPGKNEYIREMSDFTTSSPDCTLKQTPHTSYENSMFFMPSCVNLSHVSGMSARNIAVEVKLMKDDSDMTKPGLPNIYGTTTDSSLTTSALTHVFYHTKKPIFFDEFKLKLPTYLTEKHHILVSFYHTTCAYQKGKQNQSVETIIGRCSIPIYPDNKLIRDGEYSVPVALNLPNTNYLKESPDTAASGNMKWVDNGKHVFTFSVRTISTIYPQDTYLDDFLKKYQEHTYGTEDEKLLNSIQNLSKASKRSIIEYFPVILNILFHIMSDGAPKIQKLAFSAAISVVDTVHTKSYNDTLLESYVHYIFENHPAAKALLCEVIIEIWLIQIMDSPTTSNSIAKYAWFFFSIVYKSMVLMLQDSGSLDNENRTKRFTHQFVNSLRRLVIEIAKKTRELCENQSLHEGKKLYEYTAFFMRDLLSLMDRGEVFNMIYLYVQNLNAGIDQRMLNEFKFKFMKIVCDHEHFIPLNLPFADDLNKIVITDIKSEYWKRHFLVGLLLDEISKAMSSKEKEIRCAAINTLRDLLWKHDHDPRYNDHEKRARIAQVYFPYLLILIDEWSIVNKRDNCTDEERRSWLICFIFLIKYTKRNLLQNWWKKDSTAKTQKGFLNIMLACLSVFEYKGAEELNKRSPIETVISKEKAKTPDQDDDDKKKRKHAKSKKFTRYSNVTGIRQDTKETIENFYQKNRSSTSVELLAFDVSTHILTLPAIIKKEQNLFRECTLTILDVLLDWIHDHKGLLQRKESVEKDKYESEKIFVTCFKILIRILKKNQSKGVIVTVFNQFQWLIPRFRTSLFRYCSSVCGDLTFEIIRACNNKFMQIRSMACGVLLLMTKQNFDEANNFSRMKLQSTIAISDLFPNNPILAHGADPLKESLNAIRWHALSRFNKVRTKHGSLGNEIKELTARIEQIIEDNLKMEEYSFDPETKGDLYHQISRGYVDSPDLRLTELKKLAILHEKSKNYEESAMVRIVQAILVGEYLRILGRIGTEAMPTNSLQVFPNLSAEISLPKKQELESLEKEICQSDEFTEEGFVQFLLKAVEQLKLQMSYESCVEVYRLILPIYQFRRNYLKQSECYKDLHDLCKISVELVQSNRIFSSYYRVAFFGGGDKLQELDGQQYVYKEYGGVRLDDMTNRLKEQFSEKINPDHIHFVSNVKEFDRAKIESGHLYIQLVSISPYFTAEELEKKPTLVEQHFNVNKFIYETPFTKSTDSGEKLSSQWKRKTIIFVDSAFPCLKKRLQVKDTKIFELSPIQSNTELIATKAQKLQNEINKLPRNTKTLQIELQGSLLLQVNVGPAAIATEFLSKESPYSDKDKQMLLNEFVNFLKLLAEGLEVNNQMIGVEQLSLQSELINGYFKLKHYICDLTSMDPSSIIEPFSPNEDMSSISGSMG